MSLRMAMSLTPDLVHEPAGDHGQPALDLVSASPAYQGYRPSRARIENGSRTSDRIDAALREMQDFLSVMHPTSDAEALQSLRAAFPTVPLIDRIAAIKTRFFA